AGDEEAILAGGHLYFKFCAQCHGKKADGNSRFGEHYAADLTKFYWGYPEFVKRVLNGQEGRIGLMPGWGGILDEDQISQIGAYLETVAKEGAVWVAR
ncbi:MAG: cytochrome c, partial [Alphaproteobacteria bacterium]|nr:cytochrome c [Alphaproteobacteria bacterium]